MTLNLRSSVQNLLCLKIQIVFHLKEVWHFFSHNNLRCGLNFRYSAHSLMLHFRLLFLGVFLHSYFTFSFSFLSYSFLKHIFSFSNTFSLHLFYFFAPHFLLLISISWFELYSNVSCSDMISNFIVLFFLSALLWTCGRRGSVSFWLLSLSVWLSNSCSTLCISIDSVCGHISRFELSHTHTFLTLFYEQ